MPFEGPTTAERGAGGAETMNSAAIREQLDRILSSAQLRHSRRSQALLKFVVEKYLEGAQDTLKERLIGTEVFNRAPAYDTNQDSVVRTAAAETRKRLAQYYLEPGREHELRIGLPQGSYVPEFRPVLAGSVALPVAAPARRPAVRILTLTAAAAVLATVGVVWGWQHLRPADTIDRFWAPIVGDPIDTIICVGQPIRVYQFDGPRSDEMNEKVVGKPDTPPSDAVRRATSLSLSEVKQVGSRYFAYGDLVSSVSIGEFLGSRGKPFRVVGEKRASYGELRRHPMVLVGLNNNKWTLDIASKLPYYFEMHPEYRGYAVRDRRTNEVVARIAEQGETAPDEFAIVARVFSTSMERPTVVIAGVADRGTSAAGDFVTNAAYLRQAFADAPAGWTRKNIEVLLKSALVSGAPGPPQVVAKHFW
jgi:hypothetical protein